MTVPNDCVAITPRFVAAAPVGSKLTFTAFQNWIKRQDGSWEESNEGTGSLAPPPDTVMDEGAFVKVFDGVDMYVMEFPDPTPEAQAARDEAAAIYEATRRISIAAGEGTDDFIMLHQLTLEIAIIGNRLARLTQSSAAEVEAAESHEAVGYLLRYADDYRRDLSEKIEALQVRIEGFQATLDNRV